MPIPNAGVLLVEDNPDDRELTIRSLKKHNLANRLHTAADGEEAMEMIFDRGLRPVVILLDLKMPKVGGVEVLARLKSDERTRRIPVVILTSSREDQDLERCYALGTNSYIVKPVEFEDFARAVAQVGVYWLLLNDPPRSDV